MNNKKLDKIQGAILSSYIASFYINEVLAYKIPEVRHKAKKSLKDSVKELQRIEQNYFDVIEKDEHGEKMNMMLTDNAMTFLDLLMKFSYSDFVQLQQVVSAWQLKPKQIEGLTKKILKENE